MTKSYKERQAEWVKENNLKKGDTVIITRVAKDHEDGWSNIWPPIGDSWIKAKYEVKGINEYSILLYNPKDFDWFYFPYFVLKKVQSHKEWTVSFRLKVHTGDPVLVRNTPYDLWQYNLFSHVTFGKRYPYVVVSSCYKECIPYEGNEYLVGTSDAYCAEVK